MSKNKIPKKYKRFNKMPIDKLKNYVWQHYARTLYYNNGKYEVFNYFSASVVSADSPEMLIYWLDLCCTDLC